MNTLLAAKFIKLTKDECGYVSECLAGRACPPLANKYGACGICDLSFPDRDKECPCHKYGEETVFNAIIGLCEANDYEIKTNIIERHMALCGRG